MTLPYRWKPMGTERRYVDPSDNARRSGFKELHPGDLVAFEHEVWRVLRFNELDPANVEPGKPSKVVQLRLASSDDTISTSATGDLHLAGHQFDVYPTEHYPVCASCLLPLPCPEVMQAQVVADEAARTRRYEFPGVCPSCEQPVTQRQARQTWPDNLVVPNGQPVTFHLRERCVGGAVEYDRKWRAAGYESMLGFDADADAVERMLAELDGQDRWGRHGSSTMRRYASLIPPKLNLRPRNCYGIDGCTGKATHTGGANGVALMSGCESCVGRWVEDVEAFYDAAEKSRTEVCPTAHLHVDGQLSPAQRRAGLSEVKCGCRRGVMRLESSERELGKC